VRARSRRRTASRPDTTVGRPAPRRPALPARQLYAMVLGHLRASDAGLQLGRARRPVPGSRGPNWPLTPASTCKRSRTSTASRCGSRNGSASSGPTGPLNSLTPPAVRLAQLARSNGHLPHTPIPTT